MTPDQTPEPFTCKLRAAITEPGDPRAAEAAIEAETLRLTFAAAVPVIVPLREIEKIELHDYTLRLALEDGDTIVLRDLGYRFEDFLRVLHHHRNELILTDMLAAEAIRTPDLEAEFIYTAGPDDPPQSGKCRVRLYETALAILPESGEIMKIPLGCIEGDIGLEDYWLHISLDNGGRLRLGKMGNRLDFLKRTLEDRFDILVKQTAASLAELIPDFETGLIRHAAALLRDGRAVSREQIETQAPGLWQKLAERIGTIDEGALAHLLSQGDPTKAAVGCKRGLMGDLTGDMIWFLIPIPTSRTLAMEAITVQASEPVADGEEREEETAESGGGNATYFFHLDDPSANAETSDWIGPFNRAFLAVNFRREPIYLSDSKLQEPRHRSYRYSLKRLPELRMLRERFIGRVSHRTPEQWREDVEELLRFAAVSPQETRRWQKGA